MTQVFRHVLTPLQHTLLWLIAEEKKDYQKMCDVENDLRIMDENELALRLVERRLAGSY